jgi:hypothetical protein
MGASEFDLDIARLRQSVFEARQQAASAHREMVEGFASWFSTHTVDVARKNVELQHEQSAKIGIEGVRALRDEVRGTDWTLVVRKAFDRPSLTVHNLEDPQPEAVARADQVRASLGGRSTSLEEWERVPVGQVCTRLATLLRTHGYEPHIYDSSMSSFSSTLHRLPEDIRRLFDAFGKATEALSNAYRAVDAKEIEKSRALAREMWDSA